MTQVDYDATVENDVARAKEASLFQTLQGRTGGLDSAITEKECAEILGTIEANIAKMIKGQPEVLHQLVMALPMNEHVLLEGLPGTGKTLMVNELARALGLPTQRVQFIPDMLPSDLIGKDVIDPVLLNSANPEEQRRAVSWFEGPLFSCIVIADEINRAPSKVQAALLEAMEESQVSPIGKPTKHIWSPMHLAALQVWREKRDPDQGLLGLRAIDPEDLYVSQFSVFATQNPIEQEGTYPLSEAQLDRFCFKIDVPYPPGETHAGILQSAVEAKSPGRRKLIDGRAPVKHYEAKFKSDPPALEATLAPLYFFAACRKFLFGHHEQAQGKGEEPANGQGLIGRYTDPNNEQENLGLWKTVSNIVSASSLRNGHDDTQPFRIETEQLRLHNDLDKWGDKARSLLSNRYFEFTKAGASPRGFIMLSKAIVVEALLNTGADGNPTPIFSEEYIWRHAANVLRHRIRLDVQARLEGVLPEDLVRELCRAFL